MAITFLPDADSAAGQLGSGTWATAVPVADPAIDCGSALTGFAGAIIRFVQPLYELLESVTGDPAGLYQGSHTWETFSGEVQTASGIFEQALTQIEHLTGLTAEAVRGALAVLVAATHSLSSWSKVMSQVLQLCVRIVEILHSLVCAAFELLSSVAGVVGDVLFGSWPWEWDKKAQAIDDFAQNCQEVIAEAASNIDRGLQALREMVRLATDLYRAIIPFHQRIEDLLGELLEKFPPGELLGPLGELPGRLPPGMLGDEYNPGPTPYPGSDHRFEGDYELGYSHEYDLGPTDMTTEELNRMLREEFGHVFLPSREGDNSQLNMQLTGEGQTIKTSLFGMGIPGVTSGDIVVQQVTDDGFVISALPGHPEYPGEVAFRLRNVDGRGVFEVTGAYDSTILEGLGFSGNTNPAYAGIADYSIWSDMQYRLEDMMNYGR
ncbi:hypothetical protein [Microbacterium soli]|uniref:WXG100 family type VII secretion target n=1 Tax=Microbacterium soli TaxID=446075 RepID=A0ABP7N5U0_9MICO